MSWHNPFDPLMVNHDTTRLDKRVKQFDHNMTRLNNWLTRPYPFDLFIKWVKRVVSGWHDPYDPFNNKVYKNKNKNTNLN